MAQCEEHVVLECGVLQAQLEKLEKEEKYWIHNEKHENVVCPTEVRHAPYCRKSCFGSDALC
jgi:hypothetical protein